MSIDKIWKLIVFLVAAGALAAAGIFAFRGIKRGRTWTYRAAAETQSNAEESESESAPPETEEAGAEEVPSEDESSAETGSESGSEPETEESQPAEVPMTGLALGYKSLTLPVGSTFTIPAVFEPADTTDDRTIRWSSSAENVASVDEAGTLHALAPGQTTVSGKVGIFRAECTVQVIIPVTGVAINTAAMTLTKGGSATLSAAVLPGNTTESKTVSFGSDNPAVATVNSAGLITAVGAGTAHIRAYHNAVGATCTVTVLSPLESVAMNASSLRLIESFTGDLSLLYFPEDTTDPRGAVWSSDNEAVATVDASGRVTAVSEGTAHITADVGGKTAVSEITVLPYVEVESVTLSETSAALTEHGQILSLSATVLPEDASIASVTYVSDHPEVASVDGQGNVTAVGNGMAVITASSGGKSAFCTVTVTLPAKPKVVVLDPGHAANYGGASYFGLREEIINLTTAQACKQYLETHYSGVVVYLTRTGMECLDGTSLKRDLEARAQFAQDHGADVFVSLHYNATPGHNASGALCFVSKEPAVAAACNALAQSILAQISGATGLLNRGPIATNSNQYYDEFGNPLDYYAINRHAANRGIPGIIVEHCFMDVDYNFINTDAKLQAFGVYDAIGIANYLGLSPK